MFFEKRQILFKAIALAGRSPGPVGAEYEYLLHHESRVVCVFIGLGMRDILYKNREFLRDSCGSGLEIFAVCC